MLEEEDWLAERIGYSERTMYYSLQVTLLEAIIALISHRVF